MNTMKSKVIIATTIGSVFEVFDFFTFIFLSSLITQLYFPASAHSSAILFTYLTISISYLLRPIGGMILANLGDKYGRKSVFSFAILCMSIPSFFIGILPTYETLGYIATICILLARILQGFSLGAEVPGGVTYIYENFYDKNYFLYCAWITFGSNLGIVLSSQLIRILTEYSTTEFMHTIGFRIPFLFGGLLSIVGFYIRKNLNETKDFAELKKKHLLVATPLATLFVEYRTKLIAGILLCLIVSITTSIFHTFLPNLFIMYFHFSLTHATNLSSTGAITLATCSILVALLSQKIDPVRIIQISIFGLIITFAILLSNLIDLKQMISQNVGWLYFIIIIISILTSGVNGIFFGFLAHMFPTQVRFSAVAGSFNIAYILGAGLTPIWTSLIMDRTHNYHYIIAVCLVVAILSFINSLFFKNK